jgi:hypothetical protein
MQAPGIGESNSAAEHTHMQQTLGHGRCMRQAPTECCLSWRLVLRTAGQLATAPWMSHW